MERLAEWANDEKTEVSIRHDKVREAMIKLANYEEAEENGMIVRLPVGIGAEGYYICPTGVIIPVVASHITTNGKKYSNPTIRLRSQYTGGVCGQVTFDQVGKRLFLSKMEAEKAQEEKIWRD